MRVLLSTIGTAGDVIPFARVARALAARGHAVTVHAWEHYRGWFDASAAFHPAGGGVTDAEVDEGLEHALREPSPWGQIARFGRLFYGLGAGTARAEGAWASARAALAGQDLALINVLDHTAQAAARALGVPWVSYASRPPPEDARTDGPLAEVDRALGELMAAVTGETRRWRVFRERSPLRDLASCSPRLLGVPARPASTTLLTGSWLAPPALDAPLPPAVEAFLAAGPALFATFGTMPDVTGRAAALVEAAALSGARVILQILGVQRAAERVPAGVLVVRERLPFDALLPRVAGVVHHGSSGTTHEVVRAGRPSFAVPHMGDQYLWAATVAQRGLGPAPVAYVQASAAALAERLGALSAPRWERAAAALAAEVGAEDGVTAAVAELEALATRAGAS